ncbi:hypothetical protein ABZ915_46095 [Streptomyces sp. NPDC046915]|uniref:hypothetical protein n=1 Tax=Streptomyces sp. NPDC046915 TaxID=3155257 RepID=UPI0033C41813
MSKAQIGSAVATLVLIAGAAACGSDDGSAAGGDAKGGASTTPKAEAVRDAYRKTVAADTARMTVSTKAVADGQAVTAHGTGLVDLKEGASRMTLTSQGTEIEQRVVDGVVYQKPSGGQKGGVVPGGKTWMKIDLARLARSGSAGRSQFSDPAQPLRYLKGVGSGSVARAGAETVDGTATTRYRVAVPVSALASGNAGQAAELRRQLGRSSLPLDVWLDGQGRLRQERVRLALHPLKDRAPGQRDTQVVSSTVLKFADFGTKVDVAAPPASDTADVTGRLTQSGGPTQSG